MLTDVRCALARGHGLCPESMVSGWDNRPFLLQFRFFGHTGTNVSRWRGRANIARPRRMDWPGGGISKLVRALLSFVS
jgi:hypothetical protein